MTKALIVAGLLLIGTASQSLAMCGDVASWYGPGFHGRKTASGERFNKHAMTAAHKTLKFGTKLKVTNPKNGKSVIVRINDRGPFVGKRTLDLSEGAAIKLGVKSRGVANVCVTIVR